MLSKVTLLDSNWDKYALRMSEMTLSVTKMKTAYFRSVFMFSLDTLFVFFRNINIV